MNLETRKGSIGDRKVGRILIVQNLAHQVRFNTCCFFQLRSRNMFTLIHSKSAPYLGQWEALQETWDDTIPQIDSRRLARPAPANHPALANATGLQWVRLRSHFHSFSACQVGVIKRRYIALKQLAFMYHVEKNKSLTLQYHSQIQTRIQHSCVPKTVWKRIRFLEHFARTNTCHGSLDCSRWYCKQSSWLELKFVVCRLNTNTFQDLQKRLSNYIARSFLDELSCVRACCPSSCRN